MATICEQIPVFGFLRIEIDLMVSGQWAWLTVSKYAIVDNGVTEHCMLVIDQFRWTYRWLLMNMLCLIEINHLYLIHCDGMLASGGHLYHNNARVILPIIHVAHIVLDDTQSHVSLNRISHVNSALVLIIWDCQRCRSYQRWIQDFEKRVVKAKCLKKKRKADMSVPRSTPVSCLIFCQTDLAKYACTCMYHRSS